MRPPNTTFDVYLNGALPPATPDSAGLTGYLEDRFAQGNECNRADRTFLWTNTLEVPLGTNLPDNYPGGVSQTTVWVPDSNGDGYTVVAVERERAIRGADFLRTYLIKGYVVAITVKEADGTPNLSAITTLIIDQADGLQVSQPAANQARIDLLTQMSITADASGVKLVNDSTNPGNNKLYGTNGSGTKGWYDQPTGTVTSVAMTVPGEFSVSGSPVTTSGTLAVSKANQNANLVFAGPSSGSAAAPTFRALVAADVPTGYCQYHCRVSNSAAQSVPNNSGTALTFDTETWDTGGNHSTSSNTSRITAAVAGKYLVTGSCAFAANATGQRNITVVKNGATNYAVSSSMTNVAGLVCNLSVSALVDLAVNDYVELFAYQNSGGNLNVTQQSFGALLFG